MNNENITFKIISKLKVTPIKGFWHSSVIESPETPINSEKKKQHAITLSQYAYYRRIGEFVIVAK